MWSRSTAAPKPSRRRHGAGAGRATFPAPARLNNLSLYRSDRRTLAAAFRELRPDVVHGQDAIGYGYATLKAAGDLPVVLSVHGIVREELRHLPRLVDRVRTGTFRVSVERYCVGHAPYLAQPTRYPEEYFGARIRGRIVDVGNPVAERFFEIVPAPEPGRLLYVGAVMHRKRLLDLVEAVARARRSDLPGLSLVVAGPLSDAPYVRAVEKRIEELGLREVVHLVGPCSPDEIAAELRSAELLVLPSGQETSPMVIGEAMAAGVPGSGDANGWRAVPRRRRPHRPPRRGGGRRRALPADRSRSSRTRTLAPGSRRTHGQTRATVPRACRRRTRRRAVPPGDRRSATVCEGCRVRPPRSRQPRPRSHARGRLARSYTHAGASPAFSHAPGPVGPYENGSRLGGGPGRGGRRLIARSDGRPGKPLFALLALAGLAVMLMIDTEQLLIGWLLLAPVLQESADLSRVGHLLSLALYTAPPVVIAVKTVLAREPRPAATWIDVVPGLYVAYVLASLIFTSNALSTNPVGVGRGFYETVALGALVYYVIAFWPGRAVSTAMIAWALLAGAAFEAAMSCAEFAVGWNLWGDYGWRRAGDIARSVGTLTNPSLLGAFLGVGIVLALAVLLWDGPPRLRRLSLAVLVLGVPGLLFTYTRGPILATALVALPLLILSHRSRIVTLGAIVLSILALVIFWSSISNTSVYQSRVAQKQNVEIRVVLQQVSLKLARKKPVFGWGYDSFDRAKFLVTIGPTSVPLAVALRTRATTRSSPSSWSSGSIGIVLFFLPFGVVGWRAIRRLRIPGDDPERWLFAAGLGSIVVLVLTATTFDTRFFSFVPMLPWLFLGVMRRALVSRPEFSRAE